MSVAEVVDVCDDAGAEQEVGGLRERVQREGRERVEVLEVSGRVGEGTLPGVLIVVDDGDAVLREEIVEELEEIFLLCASRHELDEGGGLAPEVVDLADLVIREVEVEVDVTP